MSQNLIPEPYSFEPGNGIFSLNPETKIIYPAGDGEYKVVASYLAACLRPATGFALPVLAFTAVQEPGNIYLSRLDADDELGEEGYELAVTPQSVQLSAAASAGLFYGVQTLRQLLPAAVFAGQVMTFPWEIACCVVRDRPRFAWRGAMLDVARHFFPVNDLKRIIDLLALYKFNRFHLHLSDDQGWRLMINLWPELALIGGSTQVGGGPGGYYTQDQYREIVDYAQIHYITLVPEIEMPSHCNAALASYPELNPDSKAPDMYTGFQVGFSSFDAQNPLTYRFLDEVLGELSELTPGPYLHIGGDESHSTSTADYKLFIHKAQEIVRSHGKHTIGWQEILKAGLLPDTIVQYWFDSGEFVYPEDGHRLILSPATKIYLDMKYDSETRIGYTWAALIEVQDSYDWEPAGFLPGVPDEAILGIEAPLWTETVENLTDIEYLFFPRLVAVAEIGWTPAGARKWQDFRRRLAAHSPILDALEVNFYRSPQVDWDEAE